MEQVSSKIIVVKLTEEDVRNLLYSNRVSVMRVVLDKIEDQYLEQSK